MFGVARYEVCTSAEESAGTAKPDAAVSSNAFPSGERDPNTPLAAKDKNNGPEPGAGLEVRTGDVSGARSTSGGGSVLAQPALPGPINSALRKLSGDLEEDTSIVDRFIADYLSMSEVRLAAIRLVLAIGDDDRAIVSILSLETTSAMIGAAEVVDEARALRLAVEQHQFDRSEELFTSLVRAVDDLKRLLAHYEPSGSQPVSDPA